MIKRQYNPTESHRWWDSLSIDEKVDIKNRFEKFRVSNLKKKYKFPNMYDLRHIRISKLSNKHIVRMWVFSDRI